MLHALIANYDKKTQVYHKVSIHNLSLFCE